MLPIIAIVGHPNVGKSTLFNRFIGKKHAIISSTAGTTRDRIYHKIKIENREAMLVDTGGLDFIKSAGIENDVQLQARTALDEADLILFVVDVKNKNNPTDYNVADILRKSKKPSLLIVNKCDSYNFNEQVYDFYELGLGEPIPISALNNLGIDVLFDKIFKKLKQLKIPIAKKEKVLDEKYINICFLGRPNVGKSSLVNAFLNENRLIVSDIPGTTRDAVDILLKYEEDKFNLIDTAGIRRRGKIEVGIEKFSVLRSMQAIERSDIALLIIDFAEGINNQDLHVAQYVLERYKGLIIVINKCDLMQNPEEDKKRFIALMRRKMPFLHFASYVFVSAINKKNIHEILEIAKGIKEERRKMIDAEKLNDFLTYIIIKKPPQTTKDIKPKIHSVSQTDIEPPTFLLKVNNRDDFHFSYRRFVENQIREKYGFFGTPIKLLWEDSKNKS